MNRHTLSTHIRRMLAVALILCLSICVLAGCGRQESSQSADSNGLPRVIFVVMGGLGDKSFFDSANEGMKLIHDELGCDTKVVELGYDPAKWETTLHEVSDLDWDIIVAVGYSSQETLAKVAAEHQDKHYILIDGSLDFSTGKYNNVYCISFYQNEASYLAGALAAMIAADDSLPNSNGRGIIGAVGAMDTPNINDFIVGYIQGATETVPDTKVLVSYVGNFSDTAKAKDLAIAQSDSGVSVCFQVCAQAGLGVIEAAATRHFYAIGVDSEQALSLEETKPEQAEVIATSVMKNVGQALFLTVKDYINGVEIPYGTTVSMGLEDSTVELADDKYYQAIATDEMKEKIEELTAKIQSGEIEVKSAFNMSSTEVAAMRNAVRP